MENEEYVVLGTGDCYFFGEDHKKMYKLPMDLGYNPETGVKGYRVDPDGEHCNIWDQISQSEGPYVLYQADRNYYEHPNTPTRN